MKRKLLFILLISFIACKNASEPKLEIEPKLNKTELSYANGFSITHHENFKVLTIKNPWPKAEKIYNYALIQKDALSKTTIDKAEFDGVISVPIDNIVVTSTTHIPALELLNVEKTLIGFPGTNFVSSESTRTLIDNGSVRELGNDDSINTEVLLDLQPDVVISYGVSSGNKTLETVKNSGIPVIYNGDWVETSSLAKAEWIKFFGVLYDKEQEANVIFKNIESAYIDAKKLAAKVKNRPSILSGAMHKDVWYLPNGTSPEAQILKDANVNYLWAETTGKGSLALSFEAVYEKAKDAEIWLSPSYYSSFEALQKASNHYTKFDAFNSKKVYSFANTTGETGGVLYYELGTARPDLVLKDIIKICHPELLDSYEPYFFKPLN